MKCRVCPKLWRECLDKQHMEPLKLYWFGQFQNVCRLFLLSLEHTHPHKAFWLLALSSQHIDFLLFLKYMHVPQAICPLGSCYPQGSFPRYLPDWFPWFSPHSFLDTTLSVKTYLLFLLYFSLSILLWSANYVLFKLYESKNFISLFNTAFSAHRKVTDK